MGIFVLPQIYSWKSASGQIGQLVKIFKLGPWAQFLANRPNSFFVDHIDTKSLSGNHHLACQWWRGGICPDLSSRPAVPREAQWWIPPKLLVSMWSTKKELGRLAKNWARGPNLKFSKFGQSGRKLDFQEFLCGGTKIVIARWFLDQLTQFFLQIKAKTYIYVMVGLFWMYLMILEPKF